MDKRSVKRAARTLHPETEELYKRAIEAEKSGKAIEAGWLVLKAAYCEWGGGPRRIRDAISMRVVDCVLVLLVIVITAGANAAPAVPVPALKPPIAAPQTPQWWWGKFSPGNCTHTKAILKLWEKKDARLFGSIKLGRGVVAQLWGIPPSGDVLVDTHWWVVLHTLNGMSCDVMQGSDFPPWFRDVAA